MTAADEGAPDPQQVGTFLAGRDITGPQVRLRRIGDGHSNLTFLVDDGQRQVVLRRPPPPPAPPGAHDVLREARMMTALAGSGVPVPEVLVVARPGELLDVPCYVMTYVRGPVVTSTMPAALDDPAAREQVAYDLVDTLAALHSVDWAARGLTGRPAGFNRRHLRSLARLIADGDGTLPTEFADIADILGRSAPTEAGAAIVHNDYRIGNVVLAPGRPGRVAAVLDWELATIGDPLFDLAYFLASVPAAGEPVTPTEELGSALLADGVPTRSQLAARYAGLTGRDLSGLAWYTGLALWKLAVLYEYSRRQGIDAYYDAAKVQRFLVAARRECAPPVGG